MDEYSGCLWSYFFRHRSDLTVTMTAFVKIFLRTFKEDMPYEIQFEYTAPHTPQQNGRIGRKFATLYGKIRALTTASQLLQK
jgi:hypothetical protein